MVQIFENSEDDCNLEIRLRCEIKAIIPNDSNLSEEIIAKLGWMELAVSQLLGSRPVQGADRYGTGRWGAADCGDAGSIETGPEVLLYGVQDCFSNDRGVINGVNQLGTACWSCAAEPSKERINESFAIVSEWNPYHRHRAFRTGVWVYYGYRWITCYVIWDYKYIFLMFKTQSEINN